MFHRGSALAFCVGVKNPLAFVSDDSREGECLSLFLTWLCESTTVRTEPRLTAFVCK